MLLCRSVSGWAVFLLAASMGGCLECCTKPAPTITVDEPSRGLKIQGQTMKKSSVTEEILSTSAHDMENSRVQSQRSMSSISTLAPASLDHHGMGSTSNDLEFVNHGLVLWNQTRQQWIGGKKPIVQPRRVRESRLRSPRLPLLMDMSILQNRMFKIRS
ncbi:uncharacterized protein LOC141840931 isoform X2 [Curcuma longa]|uniref:uncharacterized protein LOC141840931 isoform X2 n=1 Tax=Curcuma longa TaxID=136217 RepID=UPI003D9DB2E9